MVKKLYFRFIDLFDKLRDYFRISKKTVLIYDSFDDGIIIRKTRPIEHYFNTLPPLDVDFKDKIILHRLKEVIGNL